MKQLPKVREESPLKAVADAAQPKHANGRVVVVGGIRRILKHKPYNRAKLAARVMTGYKLPVGGFR